MNINQRANYVVDRVRSDQSNRDYGLDIDPAPILTQLQLLPII